MRLKSYFAGTVESAICLARQEMGEEAMLVNSRRTSPEARHMGAYEVVFAASQEAPARKEAAKPAKAEEAAPPVGLTLAEEMAEMRRQLIKVSVQVSARSRRRPMGASHPALDSLDEALAAADVDGDLAGTILRALETLSPAATAADVRNAFREEMVDRITVSADLSPWAFEISTGPNASPARTVAALVGPPGVGKTAMVARLAVRYGLSAGRSTHIISYDGHRIAAGDQLRAYAAILGTGFEALDTIGALAQSLKDNSRKELILIDTPGYSSADFEMSFGLSQFLSTYPHVDMHLVLSCAAKSSDLSRMVDRYNIFRPAKLLFTRLDETESYGGILNESARTGLPVSFLGTGPRIPDDLEPAMKDRILDLLLGGREVRAVATA